MSKRSRHSTWSQLVCSGTLFLCSSCAVGPDFSPPQPPVPVSWHSIPTDTQTITPKPLPITERTWWSGFGDTTLVSLIERGVAANYDLKRAEARVRQARASVTIASADLWPQLNVGGEYRKSDSGSSIASSSTSDTTSFSRSASGTRELFQAGFDAVWELDVFGGTRRSVEAAEATTDAAVEDSRNVLITLQAEIATNYLTLRGLQKEYDVAAGNLVTQETSARISRERFTAGFASKLDVATAEAEVATTSAQLPQLHSMIEQQKFALAVLLGKNPSELDAELEAHDAIPLPKGDIPVGVPSVVLQRRPDIRLAEAQLHAATARIGVATADLFPKFSLSAFFGIGGESFGSLSNWERRSWSVGSSALLPLFDAGRIRASIAVETASQEEALALYQQTVLTALKEVESALVILSAEQKRYDALQNAVIANRSALAIAHQLYTSGLTEFITVLTAERSLFSSESALAQSERAIGLAAISLFKSLGGGWSA